MEKIKGESENAFKYKAKKITQGILGIDLQKVNLVTIFKFFIVCFVVIIWTIHLK
jgi:hypothetical protein